MAKMDRAIMPVLDAAHTFPNYTLFMQAHRLRLEQFPEFAPWEARLGSLTEEQEQLWGESLDEVATWDELNAGITVPLRCAFWYGWETAVQLQRRYDERVQAAKRVAGEVRVYHAASLDDHSNPEQ